MNAASALANNKRFKESIKWFRSRFLQACGENLFNVLRAQDLGTVLARSAVRVFNDIKIVDRASAAS